MKSIKDIQNLENKKVLVRVDFNVPLGDDGIVDDKEDWRIKATLPTIKFLLKKKAKIILITHLGRPEGKITEELRLDPVQKKLSDLLGTEVKKAPDCIGEEVEMVIEKMEPGEIMLLENVRFYKEEETNDEEFAKRIARLGDIYVNDAFSVSHRAHASVVSITDFLPSYAGFLLEKEINVLSKAIHEPERPATIIIGGAKPKTKVPVIRYLMDKFDNILVGGVVANVILKARGVDTGESSVGKIDLKEVKKINLASKKLHIPVDVVVLNSSKKTITVSAVGKIGDNKILDIGTESANLYSKVITDSKTIIWNGPVGLFEEKSFAFGTKEVAKAVVNSKGYSIIGGGDTIMALSSFGYLDNVNYVCTGGGAMLEFLSGNKLPGLEALK